jgi:hypothetical protein
MAHMAVNEKCVRGFGEGNLKGSGPLRELDLNGRTLKNVIERNRMGRREINIQYLVLKREHLWGIVNTAMELWLP